MRAHTNQQKDAIIQRLLRVWQENANPLRLGQLLGNVYRDPTELYYKEDFQLIKEIEDYYDNIQNLAKGR